MIEKKKTKEVSMSIVPCYAGRDVSYDFIIM